MRYSYVPGLFVSQRIAVLHLISLHAFSHVAARECALGACAVHIHMFSKAGGGDIVLQS